MLSSLLAVALATPLASAQDDLASFSAADQATEKVEKPDTDLSAELGGALVTGNAVYYSLNASLAFAHKWSDNKLAIGAGANYSAGKADADASGTLSDAERAADSQELARKFFGDARYDRYLTQKDALYLWAGAVHDPFAGYEVRVHEQLGYARTLVASESTKLGTEVGFDWAHEFFTEPQAEGNDFLEESDTYENVLAGRVGVTFSHAFNENVSLSDTADAYVNVMQPEDVRLLNTAALNTKLSNVFTLKLSNQLTFDNVPVEGFQKLDQTTMVTFVASIF
ncbi:DUF481 domain-containing protein [Myxococcota bacterium]|nr:DUF481 domain-containing protein [Myxococcota bacterium]